MDFIGDMDYDNCDPRMIKDTIGSPLFYFDDVQRVEKYLKKGYNPNEQNEDGDTAGHIYLHLMFEYGLTSEERIYSLQILKNYGADFNIQNENGDTVLHILAHNCKNYSEQCHKLTRWFLENGADPTIKNKKRMTPYALSSGKMRNEIRKYILRFY